MAFEFAYHPTNTSTSEMIGFQGALQGRKNRLEDEQLGRVNALRNVLSQSFDPSTGQVDERKAMGLAAQFGVVPEFSSFQGQLNAQNKELRKLLLEDQLKRARSQEDWDRSLKALKELSSTDGGMGGGTSFSLAPGGATINIDPSKAGHLTLDAARTWFETGQNPLRRGNAAPPVATTMSDAAFGNGMNSIFPSSVSPKDASTIKKTAFDSGLKSLEKETEELPKLDNIQRALQRWGELNERVNTGPITGRNLALYLDPHYQELAQLENFFSTNNFKPGQGQISNFERSLIKGSGPTRTNDKVTNDNIRNILLGSTETTKERAQFRQAYLQKKGDLLGADEIWNNYVESNPRFVQDNAGNMTPNLQRLPWKQFFTMPSQGKQSPSTGNKPPLNIWGR